MINITQLPTLSLAEGQNIILPLVIYVISMIIYSLFIYKFYRFVARKDIIKLDLSKYSKGILGILGKFISTILYIIEYIIIFPFLIFFWFAILSFILIMMSDHTVNQVLLIAMALIATIRVTAYYTEDLSKDLAKMMPFALLGVFLLDIGSFSLSTAWSAVMMFPKLLTNMIYYFIFVFALEIILRVVSIFTGIFSKDSEKDK